MDSENHNAGSGKSDNTRQSYQYWEEKTDGYVIKYGELKSDVIKASHCWYISGGQTSVFYTKYLINTLKLTSTEYLFM